jgi:hypothetical protein
MNNFPSDLPLYSRHAGHSKKHKTNKQWIKSEAQN